MPLTWSDLTPAEHDRVGICVEEAAHAIGAVLAGALVADITASATAGTVRIAGESPRGPEIAMWGIYARARFEHGGNPSLDSLRAALRTATPGDLEHFDGAPRLLRDVEPDVHHAWPAILRLAGHLYQHGTASNRHVERALGVRTDMPLEVVRHHFAHRQPIPARTAGVLA